MGIFSSEKPHTVDIDEEHRLKCPVCGNELFFERETQLNTSGMSFLGLDWANQNALNYYCSKCGYMFWFHPL